MKRGSSILRTVYPRAHWKSRIKGKRVFLSFDDGPTPVITEAVLKMLSQFNAKATFFCIGKNVDAHPDIFSRIVEQGHTVGNHSYNHVNGWSSSSEEYYNDIIRCSEVFASDYYRPPYGRITPVQAVHIREKLNMKLVLWDLLSKDYDETLSAEDIKLNISGKVRPGDIVVFHDSVKAWPRLEASLPLLLEEYTAKGFRFETL